jgi:ABC-type dipeptide/oligopeptide/nickel transport system ATPase component
MLITHDLGVVAGMCERVSVLYGGMVMETGAAEDVFRSPRHPYTLACNRRSAAPPRAQALAHVACHWAEQIRAGELHPKERAPVFEPGLDLEPEPVPPPT